MFQADTAATLPDFDKLWNYDKPSDTREAFLKLLPAAEAQANRSYLAELLTQIARTYSLVGDFNQAHATLDRVEKMLEPSMQRPKVRYLLERGRTYNSSGKQTTAMALFEEAYRIASDIHQMRFAIDAIHMVAIAEADPAKQVEWNLKGIALAEADSSQRGWLWALYNNIGESYLKLRDFHSAYTYFHKLAEYQKMNGGEVDIFTTKDEAKCLRLLGNAQDAFALMQPIYRSLSDAGRSNGYIWAEYAEDLEALGKHDEAKPIFAEAFDMLSSDEWFINNDKEQLARLKHFSSPDSTGR